MALPSSDDQPSYFTVVRASHRRGPHYITCLNSDANPQKLRQPGLVIDGTGATCYWKTDDPQTATLVERWKKTLGKTVAKLLGLAEAKDDEDWRLTDFPKGYKLFRYIKGEREDTYLLGSDYIAKFRTANEFSPHLRWLCTTEPSKSTRSECSCKYCSGAKSQNLVNSALGIDKNLRLSDTFEHKSASHNKRKAEEDMAKEIGRKRTASESVSARTTARPVNKPNPSRKPFPAHVINSAINGGTPTKKQTFQGPYVNKDRDRDLSELQCTFRQAELVWCKLDRPFDGVADGAPDVKIDYWPAICEERVLKSLPEVSSVNPESKDDRARKTDSEPSPASIKVHQNYQWKVRLLGACDVYWKDESELLAYLNYPTPTRLFHLPIHPTSLPHITDGHASDRPTISSFKTIADAITAFALSLQITVHIKRSFTLVDRYDITFLKRIEGQGGKLSPEEMQIIYEDSTLPWYQCLWWGAEKIWSGELVRLMVTAADLPDGLRKTTQGPNSRCFFLKITGLYRSVQEKGMVKGSIFELAPVGQRDIDEAENSAEFNETLFQSNLQHLHRYLPEPPAGYFFRRLTPLRKEHHLVLQHIAGRYYPPQSLAIPPPSITGDAAEHVPDSFTIEGRSLSLSGMTEGKWLHMHCETWAVDRKECFKAAEAAGERELLNTVRKLTADAVQTKSVQVTEMSSDAGSECRVALGAAGNPDAAMVVDSQAPAATADAQDVEMVLGDFSQKFAEGDKVGLSAAEPDAKQTTGGQPAAKADHIPIAVTEVSGPSVTAETKTTGEVASSSEVPTRLGDSCANVNPAPMVDGAGPDPGALFADLGMQDSSGKQESSKVTAPVVEQEDPKVTAPVAEQEDPKVIAPVVEQVDSKVTAPVVERQDPKVTAPVAEQEDPKVIVPVVEQEDSKVTAPVVENVDAPVTLDAQANLSFAADPLTVSPGQPREKSPTVTGTLVDSATEFAQTLPAALESLSSGSLGTQSTLAALGLTANHPQAPEVLPVVADDTPNAAGSGSVPVVTDNENLVVPSSCSLQSVPVPLLAVDPHLSFDPALSVVSSQAAAIVSNPQPTMDPFLAAQSFLPVAVPQDACAQQPAEQGGQPLVLFPDRVELVASSPGDAGTALVTKETDSVIGSLIQPPSLLTAVVNLEAMGGASQEPRTPSGTGHSADGPPAASSVNDPFTLPTISLPGLPRVQPDPQATSEGTGKVADPSGGPAGQVASLGSDIVLPSVAGFEIDARLTDSGSVSGGGGRQGQID